MLYYYKNYNVQHQYDFYKIANDMLEVFFPNSLNQTIPRYQEQVKKINSLETQFQNMSDDELRQQTKILKNRLSEGVSEDSIICEAFALVREATVRVLNMRHFDVQLIGGLVLNEGKIAEMKTGEGKTLVAILPTFLNALYGKGVHVVTANDYLAKRDSESVGCVHKFLGLSVGLVQENMKPAERQKNYNCDVVYITNNELGFDYLRDNMAFTKEEVVQRSLFYCVVDEVDSILIDEARTPLIISEPGNAPIEKYYQTAKLAAALQKNVHYLVDEKNQNVTILEEGVSFCEQALELSDLYNPEDPWISYLLNSIKGKELFKLNTHYIINEENEIVLVDEFTGRTMFGRRWSDGLHQAVEAKENVPIQNESQTVASITYQNLFLLYDKLSGMTGTAKTEEPEFEKIYNLRVVPIPTHRPVKRKDFPDLIYKSQYLKWQAIAKECIEIKELDRPVLVGTTTIEKSELLATLLGEYGVSYRLLNARPENIESESEIVVQAGSKGAITIATNMAGRGTDIQLGGNFEVLISTKVRKFVASLKDGDYSQELDKALVDPELKLFYDFFKNKNSDWVNTNYPDLIDSLVQSPASDNKDLSSFYEVYSQTIAEKKDTSEQEKKEVVNLGGLHVIGTERHESRRIDNQLRGRSGRQGDPGSSRFFLSLDDKLLRLFGGDQILDMMKNVGFQDSTPIQSPVLNRSLESAQKKVEAYYFDARNQLFEYDQALTMQRNGIYLERKKVLEKENLRQWILEYGERSLYDVIISLTASKDLANEKNEFVKRKVKELLGIPYFFNLPEDLKELKRNFEFLREQFQISYELKELQVEIIEPGLLIELERSFLLQQIDFAWKGHLQKISSLKDSIRWRAYGQRNPLTDYKKESFNLFILMLTRIRHRVTYFILRSKVVIDF